ncbi:ArsR/SmtB family transcription factor [Pseudovibrio ascidiaceicola]|uniref:ArsR/SmtB family transcription factor n=1 Tax=Pseudovibrio ascidiaceicola TaxID=285279 RepID=UPI003D36F0CB
MMQSFLLSLSDPIRLNALHILWDGSEHCVCELMEKLDISQSRMSRHMKNLKEEGVVLARQDAQWVRYRKNPDLAPELIEVIEVVLKASKLQTRNAA